MKILAAIFFVAFLAAFGVTLLEGHTNLHFNNIGQGLWWAIVTMTTVGYGDLVPTTTIGRLVAALVMLSGIALISIFTAAVSSVVITNRLKEGRGLSQIKSKNQIVIMGWNSFVIDVIQDLYEAIVQERRQIVLINKMNPDNMQQILDKFKDWQLKFVYGDFTDEAVLNRANIEHAFAAIILPDESDSSKPKSDETTILACLTVKAIQPKVKVIAHILERSNEAHARRANADQIFVTDELSGFFLANHVNAPGIPEMMYVLLNGQGVRLVRRKIPRALTDKTVEDLSRHFQQEDGSLFIGLIREEPGFKLEDMLSDDYSAIDAFIRSKLEAAGKGLSKKPSKNVMINPPLDYQVSENDIAVVIEREKL